MYILPHSLSLPCLHWKDTPVRNGQQGPITFQQANTKNFVDGAHVPLTLRTIYISIGTCRIPVGDASGWLVFASEPARETARSTHYSKDNVIPLPVTTKFRYHPSTARDCWLRVLVIGKKVWEIAITLILSSTEYIKSQAIS